MSSVPRSLCETNGSLLIPTDKSKLMRTIEKYPVDPNQVNDNPPPDIKRVIIIDTMAVIHSLKKKKQLQQLRPSKTFKNCSYKKIDHLLLGFNEGHAVFDKYDEKSLKNKTREKELSHKSYMLI